ncbi:hypothetical protein KI387_006581, partial [Taxus chinensis]
GGTPPRKDIEKYLPGDQKLGLGICGIDELSGSWGDADGIALEEMVAVGMDELVVVGGAVGLVDVKK